MKLENLLTTVVAISLLALSSTGSAAASDSPPGSTSSTNSLLGDLNLDAAQQQSLAGFFDQRKQDTAAARNLASPERHARYKEIGLEFNARVRTILNPGQRTKFDQKIQERDAIDKLIQQRRLDTRAARSLPEDQRKLRLKEIDSAFKLKIQEAKSAGNVVPTNP